MALGRRLVWAAAALVVWPAYYAWMLVRWIFGTLRYLRGWDAARREQEKLHHAILNPPFLDRLRG